MSQATLQTLVEPAVRRYVDERVVLKRFCEKSKLMLKVKIGEPTVRET